MARINISRSTAPSFLYRLGGALRQGSEDLYTAFERYNKYSNQKKINEAAKKFQADIEQLLGTDNTVSFEPVMEGSSQENKAKTSAFQTEAITQPQEPIGYTPKNTMLPKGVIQEVPTSSASSAFSVQPSKTFDSPLDQKRKEALQAMDLTDPQVKQKAYGDAYAQLFGGFGKEKTEGLFKAYMRYSGAMAEAGRPDLSAQMAIKALDQLDPGGQNSWMAKMLFSDELLRGRQERQWQNKIGESGVRMARQIANDMRNADIRTYGKQRLSEDGYYELARERVMQQQSLYGVGDRGYGAPPMSGEVTSPPEAPQPGAAGRKPAKKVYPGSPNVPKVLLPEFKNLADLVNGTKGGPTQDAIRRVRGVENAKKVLENPEIGKNEATLTDIGMALASAFAPNSRGTKWAMQHGIPESAYRKFMSGYNFTTGDVKDAISSKQWKNMVTLLEQESEVWRKNLKDTFRGAFEQNPELSKYQRYHAMRDSVKTIYGMDLDAPDVPEGRSASGKVKVSNGKESFEIDPADLEAAAKEGYLPVNQ